jgi:hypothetical protein
MKAKTSMVIAALLAFTLAGCGGNVPGAGVRRASYPALTQDTRTYNWLIVKCQLSDNNQIPAWLDARIQQFFGISGTGYGNVVDYFHDISYNHASVISDTTVGWITAPFDTASLTSGAMSSVGARTQRVSKCLNAIAADQLPDLDQFYGVIVVTNVIKDGGSCLPIGPQQMTVGDKTYKLACLWFDPFSLFTNFAAHEIGHGLGLTHSFDDSQNVCSTGARPGEYCDAWDLMSAMSGFSFNDHNWDVPGRAGNEGPGLSAPGLLRMGWLPAANTRHFQVEAGEQTFKLRALSHPRAGEPMVVIVPLASLQGASGFVTVEYRQSDGWDQPFAAAVPAVGKSGGAVLVHRANTSTIEPLSTLIGNSSRGAITPCQKLVFTGDGGLVFHVTAESFDLADGSAIVSMGFGKSGKFIPCPKDSVTNSTNKPKVNP